MSVWHGVKARRSLGGVLAAVAVTLSLTACGGGDKDNGKEGSSPAVESSAPSQPQGDGTAASSPSPSKTLASVSGNDGFQFTFTSAARGAGGFLTVSGTITNVSGKRQITPTKWSGDEQQVKARGASLAAMTLVDAAQKKRYYVLRDTEGNPLTTTDLPALDPNQSINFYAQFPAPPTSTTQVEMDFPGLDPATIAIS
ncbi:hypothetical protein [Streptomyces fuscigenes]|uniref:hypothetical protein n=1 Tax=Streptomyces fuscigenes TaxID=1528880 RepID=UPI001F3B79B4|nr:hypothetical protein [Streptomyces fuscigenes]MCF3962851.1 hypothetical protein [Streptomyces fuscigenes]